MTVRDAYEACLIELNKVQAPSLLLSDFVYLLNKNILEYFNKKYNNFEKIQQSTDDLRQLINYITVTPTKNNTGIYNGGSWDCPLPNDYVHILGCRAKFKPVVCKCGKASYTVGINKLDTNQFPLIVTNYYMKPSPSRPYYLIININQGDEANPDIAVPNSERLLGKRYGNAVQSVMLIICGDESKYTLESVEILYLQAPAYIEILQLNLDEVQDHSLKLEFSDYVCNEIIKQLVTSILENQSDQRLLNFIPVNKSIPQ